MEEMKREIQRLKIKTMYLSVILISFIMSMFFMMFRLSNEYSNISSQYNIVMENNGDITHYLEDLNAQMEKILSGI